MKQKTQPSLIPDADIIMVAGSEVGELSVKEFPIKPVAFKGRYYRRVKNSNHQLNPSEISDAYLQSLQLSWDSYPYRDADYSMLDEESIQTFVRRVNEGGRFSLPNSPYEALMKLRMVDTGFVTNAAMILFSKENLFYNVHVGRFKTPSYILDDRLINGRLFEVVEETVRFIVSHLKVAFEFKGTSTQRTEIFEYPVQAVRELVLNSLIHRDYTSATDVQIKIFDQHISFFNPGRLYGNITIEDLKTDHYASSFRNKLIAEAFYLTKDIEKYGSGFSRIRQEVATYPTMEFVYEEKTYGFFAQLAYRVQKSTTDPVELGEKLGEKLSPVQVQIISAMKANAAITQTELSVLVGISTTSIDNNIRKLRKMGIIKRVGAARGGHWEVNI